MERAWEKALRFSEIKPSALPAAFPVMTVDTRFNRYGFDPDGAQPGPSVHR